MNFFHFEKLPKEHTFFIFLKITNVTHNRGFWKNEKERKIPVEFVQWTFSEHFFPCSFGFFSFEISFVYATK